jgi:protein dithiol:quinone oxidoreductase
MCETSAKRWRAGFAALALWCAAGVAFALILQFRNLAPPCPLCIFQRLAVIACGVLALLALCFPPRGRSRAWPATITLVASIGAGISIRHIQIQQQAADGTRFGDCGPDLGYMLETDSVPGVIASALSGHADCSVIDWQILGVTLPMLALAGFLMMIAGVWALRSWALRGRT